MVTLIPRVYITPFTYVFMNKCQHSLHYLLPVKRDTQLIGRLHSTAYTTFRAQTNPFKNLFLPFPLSVTLVIFYSTVCVLPLSDC